MRGKVFAQVWVGLDGVRCDSPWSVEAGSSQGGFGEGTCAPFSSLPEVSEAAALTQATTSTVLITPDCLGLTQGDVGADLDRPFAGKRVWVYTESPQPTELIPACWLGVRWVADWSTAVEDLCARGQDVWLWGGAALIGHAIAQGVVEEMEIFTLPFSAGPLREGKVGAGLEGGRAGWLGAEPALPSASGTERGIGWTLLACEGFSNGVVRTHYGRGNRAFG